MQKDRIELRTAGIEPHSFLDQTHGLLRSPRKGEDVSEKCSTSTTGRVEDETLFALSNGPLILTIPPEIDAAQERMSI